MTTAEMWVLGIACTLVAIVISAWLASLTIKLPSPPQSDRWIQPCPACGAVAILHDGVPDLMYVGCEDRECSLFGPYRVTSQEAIAVWNRIEVAS